MTNELLNVNIEQIIVRPGIVEFNEYETLKEQASLLAEQIQQVEVTEENIQHSKKLLAAVNKRVKEMEDKRISIKKEILYPYNAFESQVKEIVTIVKGADNFVRSQVKELEEQEREAKKSTIAEIFGKRIKQYSFGEMFTFENFLKPTHLNKSTSMKSIETDMVTWLEKIDADLKVIRSLPNSENVLAEYYDTKDLTVAINIVNDREERKQQMAQMVKPVKKEVSNSFNITVYDKKDLDMLEMFMQLQSIKYKIEKVGN